MKGRVRNRECHSNRTPNAKSPSNELSNKTKIIRRPIIFDPNKNIRKNMIHFYLFYKQSLLLISDQPRDKIKAKYGPIFEIVNSVRDKESLDIVKPRVVRSYPKVTVKEEFYVRKVFSEEYKEKLRQSKLGKKRPDWVKEKISAKMKGKSNFEGKNHQRKSRLQVSLAMMENNNVSGKNWIYNPKTDKENRVDKKFVLPDGYRKGRDPDNVTNFS